MRADRLLSLLMLLQTQGRMTAAELATELEVTERTIYRDIDALSMAGVPIYTERGPGGGCALLDHYRTNLTGLNEEEIQALFMLSIPAPLVDLGVNQELKRALLKLTTALPTRHYDAEQYVRQRIHLDSVVFFQSSEPMPHLRLIYQAVWENRQLHITYQLPFDTEVGRIIKPYGLVAKTNIWYLVYECNNHIFVRRTSHIVEAVFTDENFERPTEFNLEVFWQKWCADFEKQQPHYVVKVRATSELLPYLSKFVPSHTMPNSLGNDWLEMCLSFESFEVARMYILSFGRAIEVLEPLPLRLSVIDFATQILDFYQT